MKLVIKIKLTDNLASSSKICDKKMDRYPKRRSKLSLQVASLIERESIEEANSLSENKEEVL